MRRVCWKCADVSKIMAIEVFSNGIEGGKGGRLRKCYEEVGHSK
jgi:hypothetical protein